MTDYLMNIDTEEFLFRCVVDTSHRKFYLYSNEGSERVVNCESIDQFLNVLEVVRAIVDTEQLAYSSLI
jgi:hypothetical protein